MPPREPNTDFRPTAKREAPASRGALNTISAKFGRRECRLTTRGAWRARKLSYCQKSLWRLNLEQRALWRAAARLQCGFAKVCRNLRVLSERYRCTAEKAENTVINKELVAARRRSELVRRLVALTLGNTVQFTPPSHAKGSDWQPWRSPSGCGQQMTTGSQHPFHLRDRRLDVCNIEEARVSYDEIEIIILEGKLLGTSDPKVALWL